MRKGITEVPETIFLHQVFYFVETGMETPKILDHRLRLCKVRVDFGYLE